MNDINVKVKEEHDAHRVLLIEIAGSRVSREKERVIESLRKKAKVPGFRPGKIPRQILEQQYRDDIQTEVLESVLSSAYSEALRDEQLQPISQPRFSNVRTELDSSVSFEAAFDVEPRIELQRYTGFRIEHRREEVTDREVTEVIGHLRREKAIVHPVDREARDGDLVTIEYTPIGEAEGESGTGSEGESRKQFDLTLGEGGVLPEIEEAIRGLHPGDKRQITVTYPADYFVQGLRGATRTITITVLEVKEVELPDLDDEFARSFGEAKDLDGLREEVAARLSQKREEEAKKEIVEKIIDLVIEAHPFEPPKIIIESSLDQFLERMKAERQQRGEPFDPEKVRDLYRPGVVRLFKRNFLIREIAKKEELSATDEDVEAELAGYAEKSGRPLAEIKKQLSGDQESRDQLRSRITFEKVSDFLLNNSEVRE
jgi:trigger factor